MLTKNLDVTRGLVNGARGVVVAFESGKHGLYPSDTSVTVALLKRKSALILKTQLIKTTLGYLSTPQRGCLDMFGLISCIFRTPTRALPVRRHTSAETGALGV